MQIVNLVWFHKPCNLDLKVQNCRKNGKFYLKILFKNLYILPSYIVASDMRALIRQVDVHNTSLKRCFSNDEIQMIDQDHAELLKAVHMDPELKGSLNAMTNTSTSFEDAWSIVEIWFRMLKEFCGDIASVFPNAATVESDIFCLGSKKNEYRKSLTYFSVEGVLHSKQYFDLFGQ